MDINLQTNCSSNQSEEQLEEGSLQTRLFLFLALNTGLRLSEILNLSLEHSRTVEEARPDEDQEHCSEAETGPDALTCQPKS